MNKREAQQYLVAYKENQREKDYALQHGVLSKFKAKYLEKIPLGNGKFRYIYEEAKDNVKSAANSISNLVKTGTTNPGKMTTNEKSVRSSSAQASADVKKQQEASARKAALEEINRRATQNAQSPNAADARMQFAKQAVAEYQNKVDNPNENKDSPMDDKEKMQKERVKNYNKGIQIEIKYKGRNDDLDSSLIEKDLNEEFKNNTKNNISELMSLASEVKKYDDRMKELAKEKGALDNDGSINYNKLYSDGNGATAREITKIDNQRREAQAKYKNEIISKVSGLTSQYADLSTYNGGYGVNIVGEVHRNNGIEVSDGWQIVYADYVDRWANSMMKELTKNIQATDRSKESDARKAANEAINKRSTDLAKENLKKNSSAIDFSRNTSKIGKVSNDYLEELEYNSRKNK